MAQGAFEPIPVAQVFNLHPGALRNPPPIRAKKEFDNPPVSAEICQQMRKWFSCGWFCCLSALLCCPATRADAPLKFEEVFSLVRSNLTGVSEAELSKAGALGLIEQLKGKVELRDEAAPSANPTLIVKTNLFDDAYAYVRIERVAAGLGQRLIDAVKASPKVKGIVLDLRFAKGDDYAAAVEAVNAFIGAETAILKTGGDALKTSARSEIIEQPVVVLVNRQTGGAAEALAAALRDQQIALLIGSPTAGQAVVFEEFPLSGGQRLKIAKTKVALASGKEISAEGVAPDISVVADERNERRWLDDPYLPITKAESNAGSAPFLTSVTNRIPRRPSAAEVSRRHRELQEDGIDLPRPSGPPGHVVQDAALARGLDFLKGLAVRAPRLR